MKDLRVIKNHDVLIVFLNVASIASSIYLIAFWSHPGLGDNLFYIEAGKRLLEGQTVYTDGFRSGTFGAFFLLLISSIVGSSYSWVFFQVVNVLGVYWLCNSLSPKSERLYSSVVFLFVLWSAPTREMLFNHQITGILCLLILASLKLIRLNFQVASGVPLMIAFDLKPHIILGFVVSIFFWTRSRRMISSFALSFLLSHIILDLISRRLHELDWFLLLKSISGGASTVGEKVNVFVLLDRIGFSNSFLSPLSWLIFFVIILGIARSSLNRDFDLTLILLGFCLYFSLYNHLYDFVPMSCLALLLTYKQRNFYSVCLLGMLIIPQQVLILQNLMLLVTLILLVTFVLAIQTGSTFNTMDFMFAIAILFLVHFSNRLFEIDYTALQALTATQTFAFLILSIRNERVFVSLRLKPEHNP